MTSLLKTLGVLTALVVVVFVTRHALYGPQPVAQPIAYSHNIHVEGEGLECTDCHQYVEQLPRATLPDLAVCSDCHSEDPLGESPEEAKLIDYLTASQEVPWNRVYQVPSHVYFSHRRHVVAGDLACAECHGDVPKLTEPATLPFRSTRMKACISCHKEHKVSTDCLTCHR